MGTDERPPTTMTKEKGVPICSDKRFGLPPYLLAHRSPVVNGRWSVVVRQLRFQQRHGINIIA